MNSFNLLKNIALLFISLEKMVGGGGNSINVTLNYIYFKNWI